MRQLFKTKFFIAVIAFGALSLLAGAVKFWQAKPTDYPYKSWTAWAIDDFLQQQTKPQVVFMGSSLVLVPLAGVDADYLHKRLDGSQHHRSVYFEQQFQQKTGCAARSFNFALPGEMPSDAFMITKFLLKDEHRPDVIVYGVGPRDFMDNLLPSPAATDPFRFLSRFGDISATAAEMMPEWVERFSYELGRGIYFYGHRTDVAEKSTTLASAFVNEVVPPPSKLLNREELHKLIPDYRPFELGKGEAFFRPSTPEELSKFVDNLPEYRKRYKTLKWETFLTQMRFFSDTLATARGRGTHVVVVAMPITDLNRQLLSDYSWDAYRSSIRAIAQAQGASFVDFSEDTGFKRSDFGDTVHLHAGGGKRLMDQLIQQMASNELIRACLQNPTQRTTELCGARRESI